MEEVLMQSTITTMDKAGNVVLDIESLIQSQDRTCSGSPKLKKALSRKGSWRWDKQGSEGQEVDEAPKKLVVKGLIAHNQTIVSDFLTSSHPVPSRLDQLKQPLIPNKALIAVQSLAANNPVDADLGDGKSRRLRSFITFHPRKILLLFATVSSMGTMVLIYFTLAINRRGSR